MGGSTVAQFLFDAYHTNLAQAVTSTLRQILGAVAATVQGALMIYIIILGKNLAFNSMSANQGMTRIMRAVIVMALMTAANYQTYIATPITTTVPDFISNAVTGNQTLTGAQGWDALLNQIHNAAAQIRAQTVGISYIADRVIVWIIEKWAEITILCCFFIWLLAMAAVDFLMPLGAFVIPFYLFDATRSFTERWIGKIIALFLVMAVNMMLGQVVVFQDAQYLQKFAQNIAARPANNGFNLNPNLEGPGLFEPTTPGQPAGQTVNVDSAIDTLGNALLVFLFGLFLMAIISGIALYIGGASGFSVAPVINTATSIIRLAIGR